MLEELIGSAKQRVSKMRGCSWGNTERATHLVEADGGRLLAEALTAEVEAVLADETGLVRAETAVENGVGEFASTFSRDPWRAQHSRPTSSKTPHNALVPHRPAKDDRWDTHH